MKNQPQMTQPMKRSTSGKNLQGPPTTQREKIEGFDTGLSAQQESLKTVNVEGLGEMEYRNEPIIPQKPSPSLAEALEFGDAVVNPKDFTQDVQFPNPAGGPAKIHSPAYSSEPKLPTDREAPTVQHSLKQPPKGLTVPDTTIELDQIEDEIPRLVSNLAEYNIALGHAKMIGEYYIEVTDKVFNYFMKSMKRGSNPDLDYYIHSDIRVYRVGTREAIEKWENRRAT